MEARCRSGAGAVAVVDQWLFVLNVRPAMFIVRFVIYLAHGKYGAIDRGYTTWLTSRWPIDRRVANQAQSATVPGESAFYTIS